MKKVLMLGLCAVMAFGGLGGRVHAASPQGRDGKQVLEGPRGGHRGGHRPPPRPRPEKRRHNDRHRSSDTWIGLGIGAVIGTVIGAAVAQKSAPEPVLVYDPACNCYYYK